MKPTLAVGWDVGGWCGKKQAVAVAEWREGKPVFVRPGTALFGLEDLDQRNGLLSMLRLAWRDTPNNIFDRYSVVLAIDAPLGFPWAFRDLVIGDVPEVGPESGIINNRFAFRECERHIFEVFKKIPLSAPFDKLGNNATVAIFWSRRWMVDYAMSMLPFRTRHPDDHFIIEVYPALAKDRKDRSILAPWVKFLPPSLEPGDQQDACICALMALAFRSENAEVLPELIGPPEGDEVFRSEGWIYHPSPPG